MRDAAEEEMELLAIMYGFLPERGIALTRHDDGFDLMRLEFDPSFGTAPGETLPRTATKLPTPSP